MVAFLKSFVPKSNTQDGVEDYEEIVRLILENASDLVAVVDFNGKRLYNNKSYQPILGDPNTLKGTNSFEDIHPEDREKIKSVFAETVRTGVGQQASYRFLRKDGSVRYIESQGYVLPGKNGNPAKVILISRDITEQKVAEDSLKNGERRFRALIESSSDAITLVNRKGMITYASPAAENILSVPCDELASQRLVDLIHHDERDVVRSILEEVLTAPTKTATEQLRVKRQNGSTGWVECTLSNMLDDPSVNAIIATFRDITDRKQLEDDLRQIQRMESIGRLAGGVAHDFNNILAIILGYSSAIARAKEHPEKIPQHVDVIQKAAQRGASLVRQLLMFARKTEAIFEQVNVNEVILDAVQMLEETFPKTIRFSLELNTELPHVQADEGQVHQTMVNLCVNARDAIQESPKGKAEGGVLSITTDLVGAEKLRTRFSGVNEERYIRLRISDTGVGMNEVTRARMFEPFFTTKANGKGTGLGLSVVFGIVQNHRGFIDVESKPGSGTTFYLYFPVMAGEGETLTVESASQEEDLRGSGTILVVEDEPVLRSLMTSLLETYGYRVLVAEDGIKAVSVFEQAKDEIALVISDLGLPGISGYESIQRLRALRPEVPFILVSGFFDPELQEHIEHSGIKAFIQKPFVPERILRTISQLTKNNIVAEEQVQG